MHTSVLGADFTINWNDLQTQVSHAPLQRSLAAFQQKQMVPSRPLRICYMLPHHNTTGGMKCLVEHIRLLKLKGRALADEIRLTFFLRLHDTWITGRTLD